MNTNYEEECNVPNEELCKRYSDPHATCENCQYLIRIKKDIEDAHKQLTGNENIKNISSNDICNYIGNALSAAGVVKVFIEKKNHQDYGEYRVLYTEFKEGTQTRIAFNNERALNLSIKEVVNLVSFSRNQHISRGKQDANI